MYATRCKIEGIFASKKELPPEFTIGNCHISSIKDLCTIILPVVSQTLLEKIENSQSAWFSPESYAVGKNIYTLLSNPTLRQYEILENDKVIFSRDMYFGTEGPYFEKSLILGQPAFTFSDYLGTKNEETLNDKIVNAEKHIVYFNTFYEGETFNEKFGLEGSSRLFVYKDKIGFIGEKNDKYFIFFNGQKVSGDFDHFRSYSCCAISDYPLWLDKNGILFFMAKRGEKYLFVEVNLNKYL